MLLNHTQYSEVIDFDGFYAEAYNLQYPYYQNICHFIAIVERLKTIEKEHDEKTIFSKILNYQPKPKEIFGIKYGSSVDVNLVDPSAKNTIALIYQCIEKYNHERGDKVTPASSQYQAFLAFKNLDILLPDNFDKTVFDEEKYAFTEFQTLTDAITTIKNAHGALEQSIKKILQQQKKS